MEGKYCEFGQEVWTAEEIPQWAAGPPGCGFPVLPQLRTLHSFMEPIAHINMQQLFILQSRLRESKRVEEK